MARSERSPTLFTIPPWRPFVDDLAAGLRARHPDPLELARVLVLLPSRRAGRALADAFVRLSDGKALLLPRMAPAGDIDIDEALGSFAEDLGLAETVPPELPALARQLMFARLLARGSRSAAEALALARQLGIALDALEIEGKGLADLLAAVPEALLQGHWQANAEVLQAVLGVWPGLLAEQGQMDSAARRNRLLGLLAERWAAAPPPHPVVMAGFSSAPPAVARLARTVARLPQGLLVVPGLDTGLAPETWALIRGDDEAPGLETHPQFGLARLLAGAGLSPAEAEPWPTEAPVKGSPPARAALVALAMRPPALSGARTAPAPPEATEELTLVEAANQGEEALVIALALRQVVDRPGRTAALVTPDRALARRVAVQLQRFGIDIDDSAGTPLAETLPGSLLIALATAAAERFAPVALLALLQHPLVRAGDARLDWLNRVRALDRAALRGIRPRPGTTGIARRLRQPRSVDPVLADWWAEEAAPLLAPLDRPAARADALLDQLREAAQALAGDAFWAGEAGQALAALLARLDDCRADLGHIPLDAAQAPAFLGALFAGETVRPRWARHPQLAIWGPLEARLQSADLLVLGGLNEGSWPGAPAPDPFLAPAIRRSLDLPGLARRTGLQAHDFAAGLGAPEVLVTRALREGGAPAVASRFWQRLRAAAGDLPGAGGLCPPREALLAAARGLDAPATVKPSPRPAPAPPAAARPRKLAVTEVALLKADPFSFYAKRMLGLKPLDPHDAEPTGGERGQLVHEILERWVAEGQPGAERREAIILEALEDLLDRPEIAALWLPRVRRIVAYVIDELDREADWHPIAWERSGELVWQGVTLSGRVDRIDSNGIALRLIDYKTGRVPTAGEVQSLYQTQLALLAAIAANGSFGVDGARPVVRLDYLKLSGGAEPGEVKPALGKKAGLAEIEAHLDEAFADFTALVGGWLLGDRPFRAKQHMVFGRRFRDYDQLARLAEWLGR